MLTWAFVHALACSNLLGTIPSCQCFNTITPRVAPGRPVSATGALADQFIVQSTGLAQQFPGCDPSYLGGIRFVLTRGCITLIASVVSLFDGSLRSVGVVNSSLLRVPRLALHQFDGYAQSACHLCPRRMFHHSSADHHHPSTRRFPFRALCPSPRRRERLSSTLRRPTLASHVTFIHPIKDLSAVLSLFQLRCEGLVFQASLPISCTSSLLTMLDSSPNLVLFSTSTQPCPVSQHRPLRCAFWKVDLIA